MLVGAVTAACSVDGFCWRDPLSPQGNYMPSIWGSGLKPARAVSDYSAVIRVGWHKLRTTSAPTTKPARGVLCAVLMIRTWWLEPLKWDGSMWTAQASSTANLSHLWDKPRTASWVVGDGGNILYWNGTRIR